MQEAELFESMIATGKVAMDCETTGLEQADLPFGVALATKDKQHFFDPRTSDFDIFKALATASRSLHVVNQNVKFDATMVRKKALLFNPHTMTELTAMARLVRNDHMAYNLAHQAARHGMQKDKRADEYIKKNKLYVTRTYADGTDYKVPCFQDIPTDIIAEYAAHDARIAYDLNLIYESKLTPEANDAIAIEQEMVNICYKMEKLGLMVDEGYTARAMEFESNKIVDGMLQYQELTGAQFVNSAKSVQPHLSRELPKTEDGNPSLNDDVVEAILADTAWSDKDHKIVQTVRFIRGYQKRVSTYYQSYLNLMDSNNIIHPSMWSAGTRTGRFSYSDPNLQNIPKEEDSTDEFVVRGCFRPRPGNKFVSFDYSQMEYKLAADYAGEMGVLAQVASGADFHQATADMVGIPRKQAKTLNFAVLYGAGIEKIAGMLGVSQTDAKRLKDKYFMGLPKVEKLIDQVIATGRERGYVKTWTGRRMYADREFCYALPNHLIQSGGADVCKKAMIEIHRELGHLWMVLQVHDQLVFDMPPEHMKYIPQIKEIMESQYKSFHGVRLTVDVSVSSKSLAERDMEKYVDTSKT